MSERDIAQEILDGIQEIKAYKAGQVDLRTVQDREQGRRSPSGPTKALLRIAEQHPEVFAQLA